MELKYFPNGNGLFNLNIKRMRKNKNSDTIFLYIICFTVWDIVSL